MRRLGMNKPTIQYVRVITHGQPDRFKAIVDGKIMPGIYDTKEQAKKGAGL